MEVSMLRLTWLTVAQHVFQPALIGRLELISRKIVSCEPGTKKNCLPRIGSKELPRFREKYRALGRQKMGSNMQPRYIQFRDIRDRDISGLHCSDRGDFRCRRAVDSSSFLVFIRPECLYFSEPPVKKISCIQAKVLLGLTKYKCLLV